MTQREQQLKHTAAYLLHPCESLENNFSVHASRWRISSLAVHQSRKKRPKPYYYSGPVASLCLSSWLYAAYKNLRFQYLRKGSFYAFVFKY